TDAAGFGKKHRRGQHGDFSTRGTADHGGIGRRREARWNLRGVRRGVVETDMHWQDHIAMSGHGPRQVSVGIATGGGRAEQLAQLARLVRIAEVAGFEQSERSTNLLALARITRRVERYREGDDAGAFRFQLVDEAGVDIARPGPL